jgi:hypothetical protein
MTENNNVNGAPAGAEHGERTTLKKRIGYVAMTLLFGGIALSSYGQAFGDLELNLAGIIMMLASSATFFALSWAWRC